MEVRKGLLSLLLPLEHKHTTIRAFHFVQQTRTRSRSVSQSQEDERGKERERERNCEWGSRSGTANELGGLGHRNNSAVTPSLSLLGFQGCGGLWAVVLCCVRGSLPLEKLLKQHHSPQPRPEICCLHVVGRLFGRTDDGCECSSVALDDIPIGNCSLCFKIVLSSETKAKWH